MRLRPEVLLVTTLALLAATPAARPQGAPGRIPEHKHSWLRGLAPGPDALYVGSGKYVHVARRGAADWEMLGWLGDGVEAIAGTPDGAVIAAAGDDSCAGRWVGETWEAGQAPLPENRRYRLDFEAVAVHADGTVYAATEAEGLYVWRGGDDWTVVPYPAIEGIGVSALAVVGGEPVIGGMAFCQRLSGGAWVDVPGVGGRVEAFWLDPTSATLFVLDGFGRLIAVETTPWKVSGTWEIPLFGPSALTATRDPQSGQLLLTIGAQSEVGMFSGGIFRKLPISLSFVRGAWFDPATELVYTANRDGLLSHYVGEAFARDPSTGIRTGLAGEPALPPDAPDDLNLSWRLGLGIDQGPMWKVHPTAQAAAYQLTLQLRSTWLWHDDGTGPGVLGTLAYAFEDTKRSGHLVELGVGPVYREGVWFGVSYITRAVIGSPDGRFGAGVRHGLRVDTLLGLVSVEIGHQALWIDGDPRHDIRMVFGVDVFMVYQMVVLHHLLFSWL